ncbi:MAG TPA: PEP-CTERM sorting domain-containing protein [Bryobacteraceae bacterium]|jgi:hypothetical protein
MAAPISPCPTIGTYQDLINANVNGGCTILDKLFSNFTELGTSSGAPAPPTLSAANISYTLDNDPQAPEFLIGFEFAMSLTAGGTSGNPVVTNDIKISYNVNQVDNLPLITSIHVLETAIATGGGQATIAETYCLGSFNNTGCTSGGTLTTTASAPHMDTFFAGVSKLSVIKDISVASNQDGGFASISGVRNAVDESGVVPEPSTFSFMLTGGGALGLGWLRIRRRSRG